MYNYYEAMKSDIIEVLPEYLAYYDKDTVVDEEGNIDRVELYEKLNEDLWIDDSVTGNSSGSYFFDEKESRDAVGENLDLLCVALREFDCDWSCIAKGFEYCDVTIRCYLLGEILWEVIKETTDEEIIEMFNQ